MAKGFGVKPEKQLGYILQLIPEVKAYAVRFNYNDFHEKTGEEFIGVTSMLHEAQVWKKKEQAKQSIEKYSDFLLEKVEAGSQVRVDIKQLKRSSDGKLIGELVESLFIVTDNSEMKILSPTV
jgi:hypothetical protein